MRGFGKSIRVKVLVPVFTLILVVTIALFFVVLNTSHKVSIKYFEFILSRHSSETAKILDTAVTELISARLLDNKIVAEAKQKVVLEEIAEYWRSNNLYGIVLTGDGSPLYCSVDEGLEKLISPLILRGSPFHTERGLDHINGYTIDFPAWKWKVTTVSKSANWFSEMHREEITFLLPIVITGMAILVSSIFIIFRRNFQIPVMNILSDLHKGDVLRTTGITELDTMVGAINESLKKVRNKTEHVEALHDIAISIHYESRDHTINSILEKVNRIIGAEVCCLVLFDAKGNTKNFFAKGEMKGVEGKPLDGDFIPAWVLRSLKPMRVNDPTEDPDNLLQEGRGIRNIIVDPVLSDGRHLGVLVALNKPGGFADEDEFLFRGVSADTSIVLSKAETLSQLGKFREVIDSAFDEIIITDEFGNITYINPACMNISGYAQNELVGKKADQFFGVQNGVMAGDIWGTVAGGNVWRGELRNRKKNGEVYYTSAMIFPMKGEETTNFVSIQRDITQEKRLYDQLLRAQKLDAIGTLAGGIAHDFNNILAAILGYAEIMREMVKEGDPFFKPVNIIFNAAEQGSELTKKILAVSRKEKTIVRPVNLCDVVSAAMDLLRRSIPKSIEINTNIPDCLPLVLADPSQLQQIIVNLAINARDAMPSGGKLTIAAEAHPEKQVADVSHPEGFVTLAVSDTGIGMNAETQRKIFDPFFTTKDTGKGTGLGLYIVYSIVNSYGGQINVYSEPGMGTTFDIYLPVASEEAIGLTEEIEDLRGTGTVLVIDDEPYVRELSRDIFETLGYDVLAADGGFEGIEVFREQKESISVVVLDMVMPKMNGGEVFEVLKTIKPDVKVILCSGYSQDGFAGIESLMKLGVKKFIQKPFSRAVLGRAVKEIIQA